MYLSFFSVSFSLFVSVLSLRLITFNLQNRPIIGEMGVFQSEGTAGGSRRNSAKIVGANFSFSLSLFSFFFSSTAEPPSGSPLEKGKGVLWRGYTNLLRGFLEARPPLSTLKLSHFVVRVGKPSH